MKKQTFLTEYVADYKGDNVDKRLTYWSDWHDCYVIKEQAVYSTELNDYLIADKAIRVMDNINSWTWMPLNSPDIDQFVDDVAYYLIGNEDCFYRDEDGYVCRYEQSYSDDDCLDYSERADFFAEPKLADSFYFGVEIEKEDEDVLGSNSGGSIKKLTKWVKKSDGSLENGGFELVSPIHNLFSDKLFDDIEKFNCLKEMVNANYSRRCGGHIHVSATQYKTKDLFLKIKSFVPLLFALYPKRMRGNSFVYAGNMKSYAEENQSRYRAINVNSNTVEFRIFPAVKNVENLRWRINLLRYIMSNLDKDRNFIIRSLKNKRSKLYKLLREVYTDEKIALKTGMFVVLSAAWESGYSSIKSADIVDVRNKMPAQTKALVEAITADISA